MYEKKSVFELATNGLLPFVSLILIGLVNFVSFGFTMPDKSFYIDTVINTVALLCFLLPFKTIFIDKYMNTERILGLSEQYALRVDLITDGNIEDFEKWCDTYYENKRQDYVTKSLKLIGVNVDKFYANYISDNKAIMNDENLSKQRKKALIRINKQLPKIKRIRVSDVLPSTDKITVFNDLKSSMAKADKVVTIRKVFTSIIISFGLAMLVINTNFDGNAISIITNIVLKMIVGLWQIYCASRIANQLVYKIYFAELSEKILVIDKFRQQLNKGEQL